MKDCGNFDVKVVDRTSNSWDSNRDERFYGWTKQAFSAFGWGSYKQFNEMRGMTDINTGDITNKGSCHSNLKCASCFRSCPDYNLQFRTATQSKGSYKPGKALTKTIKASCVVPSVAADRVKLFVLTSTDLTVYSHAGKRLHTWRSQVLQWGGTPAQGNPISLLSESPNPNPMLRQHHVNVVHGRPCLRYVLGHADKGNLRALNRWKLPPCHYMYSQY